jgi:putative methionine-R-sulfoxide reductase with GAF domain
MANPVLQEIVSAIRHFATTANDFADLQEFSADVIAKRLANYNWVGFICWIPTMITFSFSGRFAVLRRNTFAFR